jgi:hypothetical protein
MDDHHGGGAAVVAAIALDHDPGPLTWHSLTHVDHGTTRALTGAWWCRVVW